MPAANDVAEVSDSVRDERAERSCVGGHVASVP
jgi:hypothetical protein